MRQSEEGGVGAIGAQSRHTDSHQKRQPSYVFLSIPVSTVFV